MDAGPDLTLVVIKAALAFALLVLALLVVAKIFGRYAGPSTSSAGEIEVIDRVPLGYGRWLFVISWRGRRLLIGATNYTITTLSEQ